MSFDLSIVIPAYNERSRLPACLIEIETAHALALLPAKLEVIVVDDGSTDETAAWVEQRRKEVPYLLRLHRLESNKGKGAAIRAGLALAQASWILISDADASTPFEEYVGLRAQPTDVAIASRGLPQSNITVRQPGIRHQLGTLFNSAVRLISGLPFHDTQCGFKLISRHAWQAIEKDLSVDNFAWDVDLLMQLQRRGYSIAEVPVRWEHREDSRVRVWKDGPSMVWTVFKLRVRWWFR
jgi:dolichyl-phosphate beta-glucosyltransferase